MVMYDDVAPADGDVFKERRPQSSSRKEDLSRVILKFLQQQQGLKVYLI